MEKQTRKQLAKEYTQTHRPMGIYQIKNLTNGKILIGSSMNLDGIFNRHQFMLNFGSHVNQQLQRDWIEFGEKNFIFEVLQHIKPKEEFLSSKNELEKYKLELQELEELWLEELQPYEDKGYHQKK